MKKFTINAILFSSILSGLPVTAAESLTSDPEFDQILSMDISDLIVTSVSKRSQKLNDTAAAIYVLTQEDLLRTGSTSVPEALRMVPGLEVARTAANKWAITSRGFNDVTANKLLVLIDGRTVYSPVFSGTYWDDQRTTIQDIDRIEVIRGPGASIYGANAVDGVINIITKSAKDTQDNLLSFVGTTTGGLTEARHGGTLDKDTYYRVYGQYQNTGESSHMGGGSNHDDWKRIQTGFRLDGKTGEGDDYTFQGDVYGGDQGTEVTFPITTSPFRQTEWTDDNSYGGNLLAHWKHDISKDSQVSVQAYIDHYTREEFLDTQRVSTADVEVQHSVKLDSRNNLIWGGGARLINEDLNGNYTYHFPDTNSNHEILNVFAQDEYALIPKTLFLTVGSKLEYNDFTGFEVEPTTRISWHITDKQMVWGAVSRAVRLPSTYEENLNDLIRTTPTAPPTELRLFGNSDQKSEEVIAYELGHRMQVTKSLQFDTALFFNDFDNLQTVSTAGAPFTGTDGNTITPISFTNLGAGHVFGGEFTANWNATSNWRLSGSYSWMKMSLNTSPGSLATLTGVQNMAPRNQISARSYYNITETLHWDNMVYFVDNITGPAKAYVRYDTRVAWLFTPGIEASVIGRNLFEPKHAEFPATPQAVFGPSLVGQLRFNF